MLSTFTEDTDGSSLKQQTVMGKRSKFALVSLFFVAQETDRSFSISDWTMVDYLPESDSLRFDIRVELKQGEGETKGQVFPFFAFSLFLWIA